LRHQINGRGVFFDRFVEIEKGGIPFSLIGFNIGDKIIIDAGTPLGNFTHRLNGGVRTRGQKGQ
jgi:hypothetical protein